MASLKRFIFLRILEKKKQKHIYNGGLFELLNHKIFALKVEAEFFSH